MAVSRASRERLHELYENAGMSSFGEILTEIMKNSVVAEVINVVPSSRLHVNPTFAFSRAMGLEGERVAASIADGCFQTLLNLEDPEKSDYAKRSLRARNIDVKLGGKDGKGGCPYFQVQCPFFLASVETKSYDRRASEGCNHIYESCKSDPVHHRLFEIENRKPPRRQGSEKNSCRSPSGRERSNADRNRDVS